MSWDGKGKFEKNDTTRAMEAEFNHDKWQPIETAPKDGTWILLSGGKIDYGWEGNEIPTSVVGQWGEVFHLRDSPAPARWQFAWYDSGYYGQYENPTHWQPLPKPPS